MKKLIMLLMASILILNPSCKKEEAETAPEIPPVSTFEMDFSDFKTSGKGAIDSTSYSHWGRAAVQVGVWNFILAVNLAIPVAAFKEAFNYEPTYVSASKEWLWQYTVTNESGTYTAKLYGKVGSSDVKWRMLLSKAGAFTDFEWYTGVSKKDQTAGYWNLNKDPLNNTPYLRIDWSKSSTKEQIKYTNVESGKDEIGSYIEYGITPGESFDAYYDIYGKKNDYLVNLTWNRTYKNGKAKEPGYYGDSNYRCWGTDLLNTDCE